MVRRPNQTKGANKLGVSFGSKISKAVIYEPNQKTASRRNSQRDRNISESAPSQLPVEDDQRKPYKKITEKSLKLSFKS